MGVGPAPGPYAVAAPGAAEASDLASDRDDVADDVPGVGLGEHAGIALVAPFEGGCRSLPAGRNDQGGSNIESVFRRGLAGALPQKEDQRRHGITDEAEQDQGEDAGHRLGSQVH